MLESLKRMTIFFVQWGNLDRGPWFKKYFRCKASFMKYYSLKHLSIIRLFRTGCMKYFTKSFLNYQQGSNSLRIIQYKKRCVWSSPNSLDSIPMHFKFLHPLTWFQLYHRNRARKLFRTLRLQAYTILSTSSIVGPWPWFVLPVLLYLVSENLNKGLLIY